MAAAAFNDRVDHRTAFSGLGVSEEQPVLLSKGGWPDRVFNQVIIDFNEQILEINRQKLICLINVGRVGLVSSAWLAASAQSLPHSGKRVPFQRWLRFWLPGSLVGHR